MKLVIDADTYLAIGGDIAKILEQRAEPFADIAALYAQCENVAAAISADPNTQRTITDFITAEAMRAGIVTSNAGREILAEAARVKQLNAETAAETDRLILQQEYNANELQREQERTGPEQQKWENENARIRREIKRTYGADALTEFHANYIASLPARER